MTPIGGLETRAAGALKVVLRAVLLTGQAHVEPPHPPQIISGNVTAEKRA